MHVNPRCAAGRALCEEDDVGLHVVAARSEDSARKPHDGVKITVSHQNLEDLARLVFEKAVVREDDGSTPAGFQHRHDVLNEIELLVRR